MTHRPRLLSDNGPSYVSTELAEWLDKQDMSHIRGAPYHPMTQGKIERWHLTLKNRILLENYYLPGELEARIDLLTEEQHQQWSSWRRTPIDAEARSTFRIEGIDAAGRLAPGESFLLRTDHQTLQRRLVLAVALLKHAQLLAHVRVGRLELRVPARRELGVLRGVLAGIVGRPGRRSQGGEQQRSKGAHQALSLSSASALPWHSFAMSASASETPSRNLRPWASRAKG